MENVVRIYEKDGWFVIHLSEGVHGTQDQCLRSKQGAIARAKRLWPSAKIKFGKARTPSKQGNRTMYEPDHLKLWTRPDNYCGAVWPATYSAGVGQSRDSDALERSNFRTMLAAIGGETETVTVVRESHWAVGWVEWIAIHQDDEAALRKADEQMARLEGYPILDEEDFSNEEQKEADEIWTNCYSPLERIEYMRKHRYQFEFRDFKDLLGCVRGAYFAGYPGDLIS